MTKNFGAVLYRNGRKVLIKLKSRLVGIINYISDNKAILLCVFIILGNFVGLSGLVWLECIVVFLTLFIGVLLWNIRFHGKDILVLRQKLIILSVIFFGLLISLSRLLVLQYYEKNLNLALQKYIGENAEVAGLIVKYPEDSDRSTKYVIQVTGINGEKVENFSLIASIVSNEKYMYGQECLLVGVFDKPGVIENFNYGDYLKTKGIYYTLRYPEMICGENNTGNPFVLAVYKFKDTINSFIAKKLPEPQSSLLIGLILGEKRQFAENFELNQRRAGVSHVVAASGYNVSFVLLAGNTILFFINYRWRLIFLFLLIWIYCLIAGFSASIVRATIMASFVLLAQFSGRKTYVHIVLVYAITVFCIINPYVVFDIGFQLSVAATAGLIYLMPVLQCIFNRTKGSEAKCNKANALGITDFFRQFFETGISSLACTLTTLPISISSFGTISVLGVITNMLVLPVIETSMLFGVIGIIVNYISKPVADFLFSIVWVQLKYFEIVVNYIGDFKFSAINVSLPGYFLIVFYIVLCLLAIYFYPEDKIEDASFYFSKNH